MASKHPSVRYCIKCENTLLTIGEKFVCCDECEEFSLPLEDAQPEKMSAHVQDMDFCYNCGKRLKRRKKSFFCHNGCGTKIPFSTATKEEQGLTAGSQSPSQTTKEEADHLKTEAAAIHPNVDHGGIPSDPGGGGEAAIDSAMLKTNTESSPRGAFPGHIETGALGVAGDRTGVHDLKTDYEQTAQCDDLPTSRPSVTSEPESQSEIASGKEQLPDANSAKTSGANGNNAEKPRESKFLEKDILLQEAVQRENSRSSTDPPSGAIESEIALGCEKAAESHKQTGTDHLANVDDHDKSVQQFEENESPCETAEQIDDPQHVKKCDQQQPTEVKYQKDLTDIASDPKTEQSGTMKHELKEDKVGATREPVMPTKPSDADLQEIARQKTNLQGGLCIACLFLPTLQM